MSRHHTVPSSVGTMHWGFFDATLPPVAEIASGDTVTIHCLSGGLREIDRAPHVLPEHRTIVTTEFQSPEFHRHRMRAALL
jgi:acetamidase/formamidase